ncbi:ML4, partial [Symbiodinium sp. KB8]
MESEDSTELPGTTSLSASGSDADAEVERVAGFAPSDSNLQDTGSFYSASTDTPRRGAVIPATHADLVALLMAYDLPLSACQAALERHQDVETALEFLLDTDEGARLLGVEDDRSPSKSSGSHRVREEVKVVEEECRSDAGQAAARRLAAETAVAGEASGEARPAEKARRAEDATLKEEAKRAKEERLAEEARRAEEARL